MRTSFSFGLIASLALLGAACGDDSSSGGDVEGVVWELTELPGESLPAEVTPTLEYDGSRVGGNAGCNTYGGDASFDDGSVTISSQLVMTQMACVPDVQEVEIAYVTVLPTATEFEVDGDTLTLSAGDEIILVFTKQ